MIFLHHYPTSPWAEVIRLALGLKGLAWRSVEVPSICPKPDLEQLTGGYVRVPVFQWGADIFCDTAAIVEALESLKPEPTLFPRGDETRALAATAQGATFLAAVGAAFQAVPAEGLELFWADREARFGLKREALAAMTPGLVRAFEAHLDTLEARLAGGGPYLEGEAPGHADLAHFQLVWFQDATDAGAARFMASRPLVAQWVARLAAIGHGDPTPSDAAEALAAARGSEPTPLPAAVDPAEGFAAFEPVHVSQIGSNDPPVAGDLLVLDSRRIVVRRTPPGLGLLHVHFPRAGQEIRKA
ncbi:glutathione S-transferase family protein [Thermaurantiacus sp.]